MSLGYSHDAGLSLNMAVAQGGNQDLMMGHDASMMMDMDLPLGMDLDLDLSGAGDQTFSPITGHMGAGGTGPPPSLPHDRSMPESMSSGGQNEINMSGIGAGPLPTGFGMQAPSGTSTLTEFTKRRNWSQRIIEEIKDFLHIMSPDGRILYVSPSCKALTGYESSQLTGKFMIDFIHPDDSAIFWREFNESIASGNVLRFFYRFKKDDGSYMIFECDGHPHLSSDGASFTQTASGKTLQTLGQCMGVFMMARPYPTKNAALLDSFLEHKMENERLMKRIEELKKEEKEENAEQDRLFRTQAASPLGTTSQSPMRSTSRTQGEGRSETPDYQGMPPPAKPSISNTALTQQNLNSVISAQRPDSIADKMSRYEANSTHLEGIELLTGLRYRDGERSHGISTGDTSPALIRGDAGIAILLDRDRDGLKKEKKKQKVADEYVCADCGTLDSPEWRKGPKGPKTLCNACGLRWAKKEKKRGGDDSKSNNNSPAPGVGGMANQQPLPIGGTLGISIPDSTARSMSMGDGSAS